MSLKTILLLTFFSLFSTKQLLHGQKTLWDTTKTFDIYEIPLNFLYTNLKIDMIFTNFNDLSYILLTENDIGSSFNGSCGENP